MDAKELDRWLDDRLPRHRTLTNTVVTIVESLLKTNGVDYLSVTGRTKEVNSIKEKIKRKSYKNPDKQLTDFSGIRIIVSFESDVGKVSSLIESAFRVDRDNSLDKKSLLAADQIGYRSVHYVCDLGPERTSLPEFSGLEGLKFEFQIRTVLQHAWAELAHDRNYKFSGKLPREIERKLYLYAGMLEIADKGFDELSIQIDQYIKDFKARARKGDYDIEINSISLDEFVQEWARENNFLLEEPYSKENYSELVDELSQLGIRTISELRKIIPNNFAIKAKRRNYSVNIYGLLRDWMLIHDYRRYHDDVKYHWIGIHPKDEEIFSEFLSPEQVEEIYKLFGGYIIR